MRLAILCSMMISILGLATGCSATSSHQVARDTTPATVDTSDDAWTPPEDMDLSIGESKGSEARTQVAGSMPAPNKRKIVTGQIHAAN
jgi:hypothetical protein